jgi:hypothetical protein
MEWIGGEPSRVASQEYYYFEFPRNEKNRGEPLTMTLRLFILKLYWLWKNRRWKRCRHKEKALEKYLRKAARR